MSICQICSKSPEKNNVHLPAINPFRPSNKAPAKVASPVIPVPLAVPFNVFVMSSSSDKISQIFKIVSIRFEFIFVQELLSVHLENSCSEIKCRLPQIAYNKKGMNNSYKKIYKVH